MAARKTTMPQRTPAARKSAARKSAAREAHHVDPSDKAKNLSRLKRIEGQVRGIAKMVDEGRYCADVLVQIAAAQEALRGVGKELMRHHLRHCATKAIQGTPAEADAMHDEILGLMYTHIR
ncbi:MAG: metal-sensitive transcriptional regulator [Gemmatimonadetes bacterium]|nr:metal-sensitive transcriptional regulator [Gemmatimonadota bacterium]